MDPHFWYGDVPSLCGENTVVLMCGANPHPHIFGGRAEQIGIFYSPIKGDDVSVYRFKCVRGHVEVFLNGVFQFSADTMKEAHEELEGELYGK